MSWKDELTGLLGTEELRIEPLTGGCVGEVHLVQTDDGARRVAKVDARSTGGLEVEAAMLRYLDERSELPVPKVYHSSPELLLMSWIPGRPGCNSEAQADAGGHIAKLHEIRGERFGFDVPTRIGGLEQPNPWTDTWLEFFGEHRLRHMLRAAVDAGLLRGRVVAGLERIIRRLDTWLAEPKFPALLHGDLWSGNVLSEGGRITGFLDPAIYYGHPEIELAFSTLFSTFDDAFFNAYSRYGKRLDEDFFEERRHIYNLYPLLVHVRLFGGSYVGDVKTIVDRFG